MKRWPAFSLVEIAVVLMIVGILLVRMPALMNFYKTYETKQQIDLAMRSLGAHVAKNLPLPEPDLPRKDEGFIFRGTLPYKKLGIKRKGPVIQYAVDQVLTEDKSRLHAEFCKMDLTNHFTTDIPPEKDLIAFKLSAGEIEVVVTRNNFVAQYCGTVCQAPEPKKQEDAIAPAKEPKPDETPKENVPDITDRNEADQLAAFSGAEGL